MQSIFGILGRIGLVPVIALENADDAVPLASALLAGDVGCIEVTFRTAAAAEAMRRITAECGDILVGAGTVLTVQQAAQAAEAGAQYIVSPGFDAAVVDWCLQHAMPVLPGVITPTEINMANARGLNVLKFFPAEEAGGVRMLKALAAPYQDVRFIPTGGINANNLATYIGLPNVVACGGSWIATRSMISEGRFSEITRLSGEARTIIKRVREESEEAL